MPHDAFGCTGIPDTLTLKNGAGDLLDILTWAERDVGPTSQMWEGPNHGGGSHYLLNSAPFGMVSLEDLNGIAPGFVQSTWSCGTGATFTDGGDTFVVAHGEDEEENPLLGCWVVLQQMAHMEGESVWKLKEATAGQKVPLGVFLNNTDLSTEAALSIAAADIQIWKSGAAGSVDKNSGGATADADGNYYATLDATDTDTRGPGKIVVQKSPALPVTLFFEVLSADRYDEEFGTDAIGGGGDAEPLTLEEITVGVADELETRTIPVDLAKINGSEDGVAEFGEATQAIGMCVVDDDATTTVIPTSTISPTLTSPDQIKGQVVCFSKHTTTTGLRNHKTTIVGSTTGGVLTVNAMPAAPVSGDKFTIQ